MRASTWGHLAVGALLGLAAGPALGGMLVALVAGPTDWRREQVLSTAEQGAWVAEALAVERGATGPWIGLRVRPVDGGDGLLVERPGEPPAGEPVWQEGWVSYAGLRIEPDDALPVVDDGS